MAELVDALDSKSGFRKGVQVRFLFWAQEELQINVTPLNFYPLWVVEMLGLLLNNLLHNSVATRS